MYLKNSTFFYDEKALSLKSQIPTGSIDNNSTEYFYMASVCRQQTIDMKIKKFLDENKRKCGILRIRFRDFI